MLVFSLVVHFAKEWIAIRDSNKLLWEKKTYIFQAAMNEYKDKVASSV